MINNNTLFTPVLLAGGSILLISFAVRSSFGLFQIPIANDLGWLRADFSLAIAIQNLAWVLVSPSLLLLVKSSVIGSPYFWVLCYTLLVCYFRPMPSPQATTIC
jgi:hypothetical protein